MSTPDIDSLSPNERRVLYFYAYLGGESSAAYSSAFMRNFCMPTREYNDSQMSLKRKGFLVPRSYYGLKISNAERIFIIADCLQRGGKEEEWLTGVFTGYMGCKPILDFVEAVRYARFDDEDRPNVKLRYDDFGYILPLLNLKWTTRMLDLYDDSTYNLIVHDIIRLKTATDEPMTEELMDRVFNVTGRGAELTQNLADLRALQEYCQNGKVPSINNPSKTRPWQLTLFGIRAAQNGDYESAAKLFKTAFTQLNQTQEIKNIYTLLYPAYYLLMTYVHLDTPEAQKKIDQLIKKCTNTYLPALILTDVLASAFRSDDHRPSSYGVDRLKRMQSMSGPAYGINLLGAMIERYFSDSYTTGLLQTPRYAILRHEMSRYVALTDIEREHLLNSFGDKPMLTSIQRKRSWEWAMEDILSEVDAEVPTDGSGTTAESKTVNRIIYSMDAYGDHVTPYLQTLLKSGTWSRPKQIPKKRFEAKDVEGMDATDINIASHMKHPYYSSMPEFPSIKKVAPYLIDSNKVYMHWEGDIIGKHVEIKEGRPNIQVEAKRGIYEVKSNVTLTDLNNRTGDKVVVRVNETRYTVITLNERQRNIIRKLLKLDMVPTSAEQQMRRFLTRLEDIVEVTSPLLDSKTMPTAEGCDQLVVKVLPDGETYDLSFYSQPLRGGSVYCRPGYGKTVIYDSTESDPGIDRRVKRNMQAELDNYHDLIDMLEGDEGDDGNIRVCEDDYNATIGIEGMLTLISHARQNPEKISIEWPEGKELRLKQSPASSSWNVGLKSDNGWFDIEGEVKIDENTVLSIAEMLQLIVSSKGRFIRLNDHDFLRIDQKLRTQLERLEALAVKNRNKLQISNFNAGLLDKTVLDGEIQIKADETLDKLQSRIATSGKYNPEVPAALCAQLRPYQVDGFQWMARLAQWGAGACLADDMGLGKTVQTIAFLLHKASEGPAMIVAPASVVPNWMAELARFAPTLKPVILNKSDDRERVVREAGPFDIVLSTYGILNTQDDLLAEKKWATVCLDEAHTIKNRETKMSHAVMRLQAEYRIILTGTPIQNHLGELWNLFRFINPGLLGSFETFRTKYVIPITLENDRNRRKALQRIIRPFMLRRTKNEVMDDLPDKTEIVLPVEMSPREMSMYEALRQHAAKSLEEVEKVDVNALAEITRLRRAACSMELIADDWREGSSKIQAFVDLVKDFQKEGNRMLVFSQFTSFLQLARKALDEAGEKYLYFDGSTTMKQREQIVEEFRQGSCSIFLISLKAGGLGLNLVEANYVVHLDPWWNPAIEQQATDRAYRIGQNRNVTVYHLVAQNTIEEKIRRLHRTKRYLADSLLDGTSMAASLSVKDVLELISQQ